MYKIKYAILKQPLILVLIAIIVGISIGEFSNVRSIRKNADTNYAMVIESVARLENISEKKDALEIKDYDILCAGEKLELSPESQMIVSSFVNHHSKAAAGLTWALTFGFDFIAFAYFLVLCDWIYQGDLIIRQKFDLAISGLQTRAAIAMANDATDMARELADTLKELLGPDPDSDADSEPDSNSGSESSSDSESETNSDSATGE